MVSQNIVAPEGLVGCGEHRLRAHLPLPLILWLVENQVGDVPDRDLEALDSVEL